MNRFFISVITVAATVMAFAHYSHACTGITLKSADGHTIMARTIEWAVNDNHNRYVIVPRGHVWHNITPGGGQGRAFKAKYGYVGLGVEQAEFVVDGINEKGLVAGLFYFPGYGKYEDYNSNYAQTSISDLQLVSYILGCCATVDEVIEELDRIHVHNVDPRASTAHWRFGEPGGRQVVLEIIDEKCVFYENELGVLTNSPSFDWQLTNLNNYVNLHPGAAAPNHLGSMHLNSFGGGSGLLGIPGDLTPPSRFVRAAFYQNTAPVLPTARQTVMQAFHILNNFDLPIGVQTPTGVEPPDIPSATQWTNVTDIEGRKIYFRTMFDSTVRCFDLNEIDFGKVKFKTAPLDENRDEPVRMMLF